MNNSPITKHCILHGNTWCYISFETYMYPSDDLRPIHEGNIYNTTNDLKQFTIQLMMSDQFNIRIFSCQLMIWRLIFRGSKIIVELPRRSSCGTILVCEVTRRVGFTVLSQSVRKITFTYWSIRALKSTWYWTRPSLSAGLSLVSLNWW